MVSNAHRTLTQEEVKIFNIVYLVGVIGFIIVINSIPVVQQILHGINYIQFCLNQSSQLASIMGLIPTTFCFLALIFTVIIGLKTKKSISKLQAQYSNNLPSKNALSYYDTQLLCFSMIFYFLFSILWVVSFHLFSQKFYFSQYYLQTILSTEYGSAIRILSHDMFFFLILVLL